MLKTILLTIILVVIIGFQSLYALDTDSLKIHKNIIRWNITPMFVVGPKSVVLGYERVFNNSQSASVNIGYLEKAPYVNAEGEAIQFFDQSKNGGFDISIDYRFYFKKRNKYPAPDGLYWGPYTSYYQLWQDASINLIDNDIIKNTANYSSSFRMINIGVQLGYQFVFKKRFTLDLMLVGPSFSHYRFDMALDFENDINAEDSFYQDLYNRIIDSSPWLGEFIKNRSFSANGRLKFAYYGYRYGVQFGYHF